MFSALYVLTFFYATSFNKSFTVKFSSFLPLIISSIMLGGKNLKFLNLLLFPLIFSSLESSPFAHFSLNQKLCTIAFISVI